MMVRGPTACPSAAARAPQKHRHKPYDRAREAVGCMGMLAGGALEYVRAYIAVCSAPASNCATERSSSSAGQWRERPPAPISYCARWSDAAAWRSGNQISGTLSIRPSVSVTCMVTSSKRTAFARAVVGTYSKSIMVVKIRPKVYTSHRSETAME